MDDSVDYIDGSGADIGAEPPQLTDFPVLYGAENYPKVTVVAPTWLDFKDEGTQRYVEQEFLLPSPVDNKTLKALVGRQSLEHLGLALMSLGYRQLREMSEKDPEVAEMLQAIFLDSKVASEYRKVLYSHESWQSGPETLLSSAERLFPFPDVSEHCEERSS